MTKPKAKTRVESAESAAPEIEEAPASVGDLTAGVAALEMIGLSRAGALLLLAYLELRKNDEGEPIDPPDDVATYAAALRRQNPSVWQALDVCDYVRFARACRMCSLAAVSAVELQAGTGRLLAVAGRRAPPEASPEP